MSKKILLIIVAFLMGVVDRVLDLLIIVNVYASRQNVQHVLYLLLLMYILKFGFAYAINRSFRKTNYYALYIWAFACMFAMTLVVNRIGLEIGLLLLVILKELYNAFRIKAQQIYLNESKTANSLFVKLYNVFPYMTPIIVVLVFYEFYIYDITHYLFSLAAILAGIAMIVIYISFSKAEKFNFRKTTNNEMGQSRNWVELSIRSGLIFVQTLGVLGMYVVSLALLNNVSLQAFGTLSNFLIIYLIVLVVAGLISFILRRKVKIFNLETENYYLNCLISIAGIGILLFVL